FGGSRNRQRTEALWGHRGREPDATCRSGWLGACRRRTHPRGQRQCWRCEAVAVRWSWDAWPSRTGSRVPVIAAAHPSTVHSHLKKTHRQRKSQKDEAVQVVIGLIDQFCKEHLNEEYAVLGRKLAEKLGRKRPSPLLHGSPNAWASGIVRAVGGVNFLHDKSQTPYMRATDIDHYLGTSPSSGAAKLAAI